MEGDNTHFNSPDIEERERDSVYVCVNVLEKEI